MTRTGDDEPIACPHFSISYRQRSKGQSAVAGAAYQSGEKLFSEYDQRTKNYRYKRHEVVAKGVMLPPNAPRSYADRQILWNAVEAAEKQWNSQLARGIVIALPRELPPEQYEELIREYCQAQFVSRGMIADYAIHDKGDGNPHAHIMLTLRAMDEEGSWLPKARKVYMLDERGERIRLPSGQWKSYKVKTTDWDDHGNAEIWRSAWAEIVNRYLERNGCEERIDLRSYARQGREEAPTVHLGPAVAHLEKKGVRTEIGNYNRQIVDHNKKMTSLKAALADIGSWITGAVEKLKSLQAPEKQEPTIYDYVSHFLRMRKEGRASWGKGARQAAAVNEAKFAADVLRWMTEHRVSSLEDFRDFVAARQASFNRLAAIGKEITKAETAIGHLAAYERLLPIHNQSKRGFKRTRERFAEEHREELAAFTKAVRYMKANGLTSDDVKRLERERKRLLAEREEIRTSLLAEDVDPAFIGKIQHCIRIVLEADEAVERQKSTMEQHRQTSIRVQERTKRVQPWKNDLPSIS